ncbi:hypothetical protein U879_05735 [Defluviimonas sp. 20V17]|uniref:Uncharacterized protein n=1 Tax=Allgaiera indica TaxID=765699 RepID=A0AAN4UT53_9RHOB|nr:hypothetical protein [Allgaiera indica]KDB04640.1 hypothetical protein U879_05735 [Defluviimonas sp. 20V17]GHE03732.1 hypothetical protein GCM10008024_28260 [Allgaiera indica]SDX73739.1 hypothetical protein SAMN05444006_12711 [Allgaiera indica]
MIPAAIPPADHTRTPPPRPRLLLTAAAILFANGGARTRPLETALRVEAELDAARRAGRPVIRWADHVQALADLLASIAADKRAQWEAGQ